MRFLVVLIVISTVSLIACSGNEEKATLDPAEYATGKVALINSDAEKFTFNVEIPLTEQGRIDGLAFMEHLDEDKAMLYAYEDDMERRFWMKHTLIDLDMLFIGSDYRIKTIIHKATPCTQDPCLIYESGVPVRYVLEIKGGLADKLKLKEGDLVEIDSVFSNR